MFRTFAYTTLTAATLAFAVPAFAQETPPAEISSAVAAAESTGVLEALLAGGEVTVFVPTNEALEAAPQDALSELTADPEALGKVIRGYAVEGNVMAADVVEMAADSGMVDVETMSGAMLHVTVEDGAVTLKGKGDTMATVTTPDLQFGSITVHLIDAAILPDDGM